MLSISILEPLEICLNLITFNFVYHGDKVIRIPIESYKLVKYLTFYGLAKLVLRHIDFPFLFMSLSKIDTIWDTGNGSCYSIVTNEIQENEKLGKKDVCGFYIAEYVGANRGYVVPLLHGSLTSFYIFANKINDIRVVCMKAVGLLAILNKVASCYPDTYQGRLNSAAVQSIVLRDPFYQRFNVLEMLIKFSATRISKTAETPVDLLIISVSQNPKHTIDIMKGIMYQFKRKQLSINPLIYSQQETTP